MVVLLNNSPYQPTSEDFMQDVDRVDALLLSPTSTAVKYRPYFDSDRLRRAHRELEGRRVLINILLSSAT